MANSKNTYDYIGCEYYRYGNNGNTNLVIAMAHGVTSNPYNDTYYDGNQVIVISKNDDDDTLYGFLAVADGTDRGAASNYWANFNYPDNTANGIEPVTKVHAIPADLAGNLSQRGISTANRAAVATYLLRQG